MQKPTVSERFWSKVQKGDGCWEWQGRRDPTGYGRLDIERPRLAHRLSWEFANGPIPSGLHVCHHCDNPPCVRPDHLFLGTDADNMQDASRKGRMSTPKISRGSLNVKARLIESQVMEIRQRWSDGETARDLGAAYGVAEGTVEWIVRGRSWKHLPIIPRSAAGLARLRQRTTDRQRNSPYAKRGTA